MELKNAKSLLKGEISLDEIYELLASSKLDKELIDYYFKDALDSDYDTVVCEGDLTIEGNFCPWDADICNLIITGNLTVNGLLEYYEDPASMLFVGGNIKAKDLSVGETLEVGGNLEVHNAILGFAAETGIVGGNMSARFFLPGDYSFEVKGKINIESGFQYEHRVSDEYKELPFLLSKQLYLLLVNDAFTKVADEEDIAAAEEAGEEIEYFEYVSFEKILDMLREGVSIYK